MTVRPGQPASQLALMNEIAETAMTYSKLIYLGSRCLSINFIVGGFVREAPPWRPIHCACLLVRIDRAAATL